LRYLLALLLMTTPVFAHDHGRPELNNWFLGLHNKLGYSCCDGSEAKSIEDPDWEFTPDAGQICTRPSTLNPVQCQATHYRVRMEGKWVAVPDNRVVLDPNRYGQALVWPTYENGHATDIRCFMPGAGT